MANRDTTQTCIAGEYFVLAELARRDAVASMTLRNSKGVDILVAPLNRDCAYKVEVKTARNRLGRCRLFHGAEKCLQWRLSKKHESISGRLLVYVLVHLPDPPDRPRFFIVPSATVARYVRWEHAFWLGKVHGKETDMRVYRIPESEMAKHENNWRLLGVDGK